ncbi:MAG: endo-1,4-beta-xylanase [Planctomycetota bacterium]
MPNLLFKKWLRARSSLNGFLGLAAIAGGPAAGQDLSHRQTSLSVAVQDAAGQAVAGVNFDLAMREHDFRFGTQIDSRDYLNNDAERDQLHGLFNSFTFTTGAYWRITESNENNARNNLTAAAALANQSGKHVRGHTVIWPQNKGWLNPEDTLPQYTYKPWLGPDPVFNSDYNPSATHLKNRIDGRIADFLALTSPDGNPHGGLIDDFDATNETIDFDTEVAPGIDGERVDIFTPRLVEAGLYADKFDAYADWYVQMRAARPDARLVFNETAVLAPFSDDMAYEVRDLVQTLLDRGAPIDAIGVQAHMFNGVRSLGDLNRKIDILAQTGLPVEITEFDNFNGGAFSSSAAEAQSFENVLRAAFENPNVEGFTLWGHRDDTHWVGNSPLFDAQGNLKPEGQPYFDLVLGEWWTDVQGAQTDTSGTQAATLTRGTYDLTIEHDGQAVQQTVRVATPFAELVAEVGPGGANAAWLLGDTNGDDETSLDDVSTFLLAMDDPDAFATQTGLDPLDRADTDRDGQVTLRDFLRFANYFEAEDRAAVLAAGPDIDLPAGDFDASGRVEQGDLNLVLNNWGSGSDALPLGWLTGRPVTGIVGQEQLNAVLNNWGASTAPDLRGLPAPEPGAAAIGLITLGVAARRRRTADLS